MLELIAEIILIASIIGILFIFFRKMPALVNLPEIEKVKFLKREKLKRAKPEFKKEKEVNFSDDYWEKIRKG